MDEEEIIKKGRRYIYYLLSRQSYPTAQLKKKLLSKEIPSHLCDQLIEEFTENGYLNDEEWTKRFIQRKIEECKSSKWIYFKLLENGVSSDMISSFIEQEYSKEQEIQVIQQLLERKNWGSKALAKLQRRGFSYNVIENALSCTR